ncbi:MAG: family 10 glycosylhydrolase [Muribaculaceae bacterium]|nr:family 10 glycosylhydrolase [Muribaculaceae bacterium]
MKKLFVCMITAAAVLTAAADNPKREFRGAWMHTVFQEQYHKQNTEQNKAYIRDQFDRLQNAGVNAVIFQVRPQADAFYPSELEPWSRFLTDNGSAPVPEWDPLQFVIDEAHARGMELHAWLNPYRVTTSKTQTLPQNHIYHKHPEWFVRYDGKLYFDPGLPESRQFITDVVMDIVNRYDVDGIHFDDYFYPYPVKGEEFPDSKSYAKYGEGMKRDDWRRQNVDQLIEGLHKEISATKPWVIFGISPFGIWRNESSDPRGSKTNGLQNYDALYADVLLWSRNGWIDYLLPQLYWELEHKTASYLTLVDWWNRNAEGRNMYIGQDVGVTMKKPDIGNSGEATQLRHKVELTREADNIQGNCWWPGYSITRNHGGVADSLAIDLQATVALPPLYPWISTTTPSAPKNAVIDGEYLTWQKPATNGTADDAVKFVVYRFEPGDPVNLEDAEAIEGITWDNRWVATDPGVYVVTSLSRVNQESKPTAPVTVK